MHKENSSISNFKKFITKILLPVLLIVGVVSAIFCIWFEKKIILGNTSCGAYKVNRILTINEKDEIPIFGSSRAETSFIPEILGPGFFNYGINGTQDDVLLFFLKEECKKKGKSSPLIIANMDCDGLNRKSGDMLNYIYNSNDPEVKKLMGKSYQPQFGIPFIKYVGQFQSYFRYYLNDKVQYGKYSNKGALIETTKLSPRIIADLLEYRRTHEDVFYSDPLLEKEMFQLIDDNPDRFFVFVVPPYHSSYFTNFKNPQNALGMLKKFDDLPNVKVFNFTGVGYPDSLFFNTTHLNYFGAVRFSKQFKDSLNTLKIQ